MDPREKPPAPAAGDTYSTDEIMEVFEHLEPMAKSLIHGHHSDYSKPLEVEWLCARCHAAKHPEADDGD